MSAPNTNIEKQAEKHKGPLGGISLAVIFAGALLVALIVWTFAQQDGIEGADVQIDGRTGAVEEIAE